MWYLCTAEYYLAIKKDKCETFVKQWMPLENIMLSEIKHISLKNGISHLSKAKYKQKAK